MALTAVAREFWERKERETGGPILYRSFAILLGRMTEGRLDRSGILFVSGNSIHFEDFEKQDPLSWLFRRKKKPYSQYITSVSLSDVSEIRLIPERDAVRVLKGTLPPSRTRTFSLLNAVGSKRISQIILRNDDSLFLEVLDHRGLAEISRRGAETR